MASSDDRKKRIMEHLARSINDFSKPSMKMTEERKQQIKDHVRRTTG
ncbi:MAG: hypothetical protein HY785_27105 [Oscillatoriophycideae cyanobacterium NC_groundwater_1537_Pr4_S-0.65um_50_18]|nr:hypothetical protein [Oscillatoriophycideae cyanobacterium NC_groundwater_1537_Pr4_S-0.65um_50_18]